MAFIKVEKTTRQLGLAHDNKRKFPHNSEQGGEAWNGWNQGRWEKSQEKASGSAGDTGHRWQDRDWTENT
eukprot:11493518-Heterocapsa_arctica.AAC.1